MGNPDFPAAADGSRGHDPRRRDSDTNSDDGFHRFEQQGRRQLPPPSSWASFRNTLEQRDLLPIHRVPHATVTFAGHDFDDDASHTPCTGLQFACSSDVSGADRGGPSWMTQSGDSVGSIDGDCEYNSNYGLRRLLLPPPRQRLLQSRPEMSDSTPAPAQTPPPDPASQGNGRIAANTGSGHSRRRTMTPEERRKARTCVADGCNKYIVDNHRCFRHGGGKRCAIDGCNSSAKQLGLCWRHGGAVLCKVDGCNRGMKIRGLCWRHGGGKKKQHQAAGANVHATTLPADSPYPRCIFDGCQSAPSLHSFCDAHAQDVAQPGYIFEL